MKRRVLLRRDVPDDLASTVDYLAEKSPDAARRFVDSLPVTLIGLAEMPGKGSPKRFRDRRLAGVRSWYVQGFRNYLILYRLIPEAIEVLAIVHGSKDLKRLLRGRV